MSISPGTACRYCRTNAPAGFFLCQDAGASHCNHIDYRGILSRISFSKPIHLEYNLAARFCQYKFFNLRKFIFHGKKTPRRSCSPARSDIQNCAIKNNRHASCRNLHPSPRPCDRMRTVRVDNTIPPPKCMIKIRILHPCSVPSIQIRLHHSAVYPDNATQKTCCIPFESAVAEIQRNQKSKRANRVTRFTLLLFHAGWYHRILLS